MILKNISRSAAIFFPVLSGLAGCSSGENRPNIIIILSDDQGWGDLSINGNTNLKTPNIDRLAKGGAIFNHFYACAVSSPTRAELLTGRYHSRMGVYSTSEGGERINPDETTIAQVFKKAGYSTAAFGKWHSGMQYPYHPNARGFDEYYGFCSGHWGEYFYPQLEHNGKIVQGTGFITDDLTEKALDFIDKHQDEPFFIYLPYNAPHAPLQVPDYWWNKFKDKELEMLADEPDKEDIQFTRAVLAMCENIDWNVGRIMDRLKELNMEENTIVLYFCDNGPNGFRWNGGMKGRKGSVDEGGVRSPLIMRWPGNIVPGLKIDEISGAIDLLPTLADMAGIGIQTQKPLDGVSLMPLLLEQEKKLNDRLIFNHWNGRLSVRSQEYRLDNEGKLFNMISDPGQKVDISTDQPEVTAKLKAAAGQWKADVFSGKVIFDKSNDDRRFPVGHPDFKYTQLPARDAKAFGNIVRSNPSPNSTFYTKWTSPDDKITWDVEVLSDGNYEAELYYTCPARDLGATVQLSFNSNTITTKITEAFDPPLRGMESDRVKRTNSYVKDFKPLKAGIIHLEKGTGELTLKALDIPGSMVMDFRLLMLTKVEKNQD